MDLRSTAPVLGNKWLEPMLNIRVYCSSLPFMSLYNGFSRRLKQFIVIHFKFPMTDKIPIIGGKQVKFQLFDFMAERWTLGCFSKDTLKKIKCTPHHITGGYLGRSYPEGEADQTSLGGWHWHLKFDHFWREWEGGEVSRRWAGDEREVSSSWNSPLHHTPPPSSNAQPLKTWPWSLQSNMLKKILPKVQQTQMAAIENWQKMVKL